jgi:hypothetical protein
MVWMSRRTSAFWRGGGVTAFERGGGVYFWRECDEHCAADDDEDGAEEVAPAELLAEEEGCDDGVGDDGDGAEGRNHRRGGERVGEEVAHLADADEEDADPPCPELRVRDFVGAFVLHVGVLLGVEAEGEDDVAADGEGKANEGLRKGG